MTAIPKIAALFETSLASALSAAGTSFTVVSGTDRDGSALSGLYGFIIDEGTADEEFVTGTISGTTVTISKRGCDANDPETEVSANKKAHRRGASIKITDYPIMAYLRNVLAGESGYTLPALLRYASGVGNPINPDDLVRKAYVDALVLGSLTTINVIIPGKAGETVADGNLLYFDESDNEWKKCDADTAATVNNTLLGIAQGAGTDGNAITNGVLLQGVDDAQSGLTEGDVQYASNTAGAISSTPGTTEVTVGIAKSATELYFNPRFNQQITEDQQDALASTKTPDSGNKFMTQRDLQFEAENYAVATGSSNAYAVTLSPNPNALGAGMRVKFKANHTNTGAATLNVNSGGGVAIKKNGSSDLASGDIQNGQVIEVVNDGTNWQMISPVGQTIGISKVSLVTSNVTVADTTTETDLISVTIAGGILGTANGVRARLMISAAGVTGTPTLTLRLKYGATTLATITLSTLISLKPAYIDVLLLATGATNSQEALFSINQFYSSITNVNQLNSQAEVGTSSEDSTTDKTLKVTAQWGTASASNTLTLAHALIEKIA